MVPRPEPKLLIARRSFDHGIGLNAFFVLKVSKEANLALDVMDDFLRGGNGCAGKVESNPKL
jgi:hypothetical protein